jgi:methionine-rich copper-binding protein CopC
MSAATLDAEADAVTLSRACAALWTATLALMTAFMQNPAPAHRYLIARKIARNQKLLHEQDCFTTECRMIFSNLSQRWSAKADLLAGDGDRPRGGFGLMEPALAKSR